MAAHLHAHSHHESHRRRTRRQAVRPHGATAARIFRGSCDRTDCGSHARDRAGSQLPHRFGPADRPRCDFLCRSDCRHGGLFAVSVGDRAAVNSGLCRDRDDDAAAASCAHDGQVQQECALDAVPRRVCGRHPNRQSHGDRARAAFGVGRQARRLRGIVLRRCVDRQCWPERVSIRIKAVLCRRVVLRCAGGDQRRPHGWRSHRVQHDLRSGDRTDLAGLAAVAGLPAGADFGGASRRHHEQLLPSRPPWPRRTCRLPRATCRSAA